MVDQLRLSLLGAAEASFAGRPLAFRTRKSFALLAYLALDPIPHRRERIAELLWPEGDGEDARASLRTALNYLRHGIGPLADGILAATRDTVGLRRGAVEADVGALRQAQQLAHQFDAGLRRQLELTINRYRGPFLAGMFLPDAPEFEAWIESQRAHWRAVAAELLSQLAKLQAEAGETGAAEASLEKWANVEPDVELPWRRLIELQLSTNNRAAARRAWDRFCGGLASVNATPSSAMTRLHEQIAGPAPTKVQAVGASSRDVDFPPFVGRRREWAQLTASHRRAEEGRTEVVILQGSSGVGKSRLVSEFGFWAQHAGSDVIAGRGFGGVSELPYAALVDGLRPRLEAENAPDDLLSDLWLGELSRLLPELRERYTDLAVPTDDRLTRARIFEAVTRLGMGLARRKPLVWLIDDAQCTDADTQDLLRYAVRRWNETRTSLLLVLSARDGPASDGVEPWLSALESETSAPRLWLDPLQPGEVTQLVGILAEPHSADGAGDLGRWLAEKTGGRPRSLVQTLRGLVERGVLRLRPLDERHWTTEPPANSSIPEPEFAGVPRGQA
jgi:DNA-binding SARP family transcriptional activator